jgi:hypothetical protein
VITLTREELDAWIERDIERRLRLTREEFERRRSQGTLPHTIAVRDIEMLYQLAEQKAG